MSERPTTKHNIQRDELNTIRPNFAEVTRVFVTGSIGMIYSGVDVGTGDVTLYVTGTSSGGGDYCQVYNSTNQTVNTGVITAITFDSETADTNTMHSTVTDTSRITIKRAGLYLIIGRVRFANNTTGIRETEIYLNGLAGGTANIIGINTQPANGGASLTTVTAVCIRSLAINDYIEVAGFQNSGSNLATEGGAAFQNNLSVTQIG